MKIDKNYLESDFDDVEDSDVALTLTGTGTRQPLYVRSCGAEILQ
jgi:hypothetical protein